MGVWETQIVSRKQFDIPPELMEAHFAVNGLSAWNYRTMPEYLYRCILAYWYLETFASKQKE